MDWEKLINSLGLPVVIMGVFGYALWRIIVWCRDNVVVPITKSHIELIDNLKANLPAQAAKLDKVAEIAQVTAAQNEKSLGEIKEAIDDQTHRLEIALKPR
jgi:hypothetical protein